MVKKYIQLLFLIIVSIFILSSPVFANVPTKEFLPLADKEQIWEQIEMNANTIRVFTEHNSNYYLKEFIKNNSNIWVISTEQQIIPKKTGLNINGTIPIHDKALAETLENKFQASFLPSKLDYSNHPYLPPVGTQQENSCVGWSVGYYLRTFQEANDYSWRITNDNQILDSRVFSPTFIYNLINNGEDNGASLDDAGNLLKYIGAAPLSDFPYRPGDYYTVPAQEVINKAYPHRVKDWRILFTQYDSHDYIVQKIKEYLNTGDLIVVGSKVGFKFQFPMIDEYGNSIITTDYYPSYNHAYVVVGYDDSFQTPEGYGAFKIINSWGEEWGNSGYSYLSYQALTTNAIAGYVFTDLVNGPIQPIEQELPVSITHQVKFKLNFTGRGQYDIKITDSMSKTLYQEYALNGMPGINEVTWSGNDMHGKIVPAGTYKLVLTTYDKHGNPTMPFEHEFVKLDKVINTQAISYWIDSDIQNVTISVTPQTAGLLNIDLIVGEKKQRIITNDIIKVNETKTYEFDNDAIKAIGEDFNSAYFEINAE